MAHPDFSEFPLVPKGRKFEDFEVGQVLSGPPAPLETPRWTSPGSRPLDVPEELSESCRRAMASDPVERFQTAGAFAAELQAWLDGSRKREQAMALVDRAAVTVPDDTWLLSES